jgi:hypothetical protein
MPAILLGRLDRQPARELRSTPGRLGIQSGLNLRVSRRTTAASYPSAPV